MIELTAPAAGAELLTSEELHDVFSEAAHDSRSYALICLSFWGLAISEIADLRVYDVNGGQNRLQYRRGGSTHLVSVPFALSMALMACADRRYRETGAKAAPLFWDRGTAFTAEPRIKTEIMRIFVAAGVRRPGLTPHSLELTGDPRALWKILNSAIYADPRVEEEKKESKTALTRSELWPLLCSRVFRPGPSCKQIFAFFD